MKLLILALTFQMVWGASSALAGETDIVFEESVDSMTLSNFYMDETGETTSIVVDKVRVRFHKDEKGIITADSVEYLDKPIATFKDGKRTDEPHTVIVGCSPSGCKPDEERPDSNSEFYECCPCGEKETQ